MKPRLAHTQTPCSPLAHVADKRGQGARSWPTPLPRARMTTHGALSTTPQSRVM